MAEGGSGVVPRRTGATGHATLRPPRRRVQVFFQSFPGTDAASGIAGLAFTVTFSDGRPDLTGTTGADGRVEFELATTESAELRILGSVYTVRRRTSINAIGTVRGQQQRLGMLGYYLGPNARNGQGDDGDLGAKTETSILQFQADHGPLRVDGIAGANTRPRLQQVVRDAGGE